MKFLKIFFINFLILALLCIIFESCIFFSLKKKYPNLKYRYNISYADSIEKMFPRPPAGLEYKKAPIMILGCSYSYGLFLEEKKSPHHILSELTQRPVFNYSLPGKGFQHSLYILQNKILDKKMSSPKYVIYFMMNDHIRRMYSPVMFSDLYGQPVYKLDKNSNLVFVSESLPWYRKAFLFYYFWNYYYFNWFQYKYSYHQKYVLAYLRQINYEIKKLYPDAKFVVVLYDDFNRFGIDFSPLEKDGIRVLQTKEITGENLLNVEKYTADDNSHPNEVAWNLVLPALVKELNL